MLAKIAVANYMAEHITTVTPETDITVAFRKMLDHKVTSMPVLDGQGKLVGIFSEKDGMKVVVESVYNQSMAGKVGEFMSTELKVVDAEDSLVDVAARFQNTHIRSFPVFRNGEMVGLISRVDVLRALVESH